MKTLKIVVPVFNDWASLNILLRELDDLAGSLRVAVSVSCINDGSTDSREGELSDVLTLSHLSRVEIVDLLINVGHQRAIAIGLCVAVQDNDSDAILIMDADGEDSPDAIPRLLAVADGQTGFCVVAQRRRRSENLSFRLSYVAYKSIFKLMTARQINFGNFSLLSRAYARRLVHVADLWNNLPAAILRSRLPIQPIEVDRAARYTGTSKMKFTSLVVHGLSGISVYAETIFVRLLMLTLILVGLSAVSIGAVLALRLFFPGLATPGWATTVSFGMMIILVQMVSVTLSSILMLLNSRVQRLIVPIVDFAIYVDSRQVLFARGHKSPTTATSNGAQGMEAI